MGIILLLPGGWTRWSEVSSRTASLWTYGFMWVECKSTMHFFPPSIRSPNYCLQYLLVVFYLGLVKNWNYSDHCRYQHSPSEDFLTLENNWHPHWRVKLDSHVISTLNSLVLSTFIKTLSHFIPFSSMTWHSTWLKKYWLIFKKSFAASFSLN